jgi:hypothetical protein
VLGTLRRWVVRSFKLILLVSRGDQKSDVLGVDSLVPLGKQMYVMTLKTVKGVLKHGARRYD